MHLYAILLLKRKNRLCNKGIAKKRVLQKAAPVIFFTLK